MYSWYPAQIARILRDTIDEFGYPDRNNQDAFDDFMSEVNTCAYEEHGTGDGDASKFADRVCEIAEGWIEQTGTYDNLMAYIENVIEEQRQENQAYLAYLARISRM